MVWKGIKWLPLIVGLGTFFDSLSSLAASETKRLETQSRIAKINKGDFGIRKDQVPTLTFYELAKEVYYSRMVNLLILDEPSPSASKAPNNL